MKKPRILHLLRIDPPAICDQLNIFPDLGDSTFTDINIYYLISSTV